MKLLLEIDMTGRAFDPENGTEVARLLCNLAMKTKLENLEAGESFEIKDALHQPCGHAVVLAPFELGGDLGKIDAIVLKWARARNAAADASKAIDDAVDAILAINAVLLRAKGGAS